VKVLVLTVEPVNAEMVRGALGEEAEGTEVLVVSPALQDSPLRFWIGDADQSIQRAEEVQQETVERLEEEGVDAAGDTGESEPLLAVQDALSTFDADRILVFTHPGSEQAYREDELDEIEHRFGVPVVHSEVGR
jgi:hypothetical protein